MEAALFTKMLSDKKESMFPESILKLKKISLWAEVSGAVLPMPPQH